MRMIRNRNNENKPEGYVLTFQRQIILEEIRRCGRLLDAKELYHLVSLRDASISLATIYRSLILFKQLGLIDEHRLEKSQCYYELKQSLEHQHMICDRCRKVTDFEIPLITQMVQSLKEEKGFIIDKIELCVHGTCRECQNSNE
jgi:Fur family ferric uptake transcriptional regulator